jgi:hypothetical protein
VSRVSHFSKSEAILKRLSKVDMTTCHGCKKTIWFLPFEKYEKVSHTDRGDDRRDTQYKPVVKCWWCHFKERLIEKLNDLAWRAVAALGAPGLGVMAILIALAVSSFFIENKNAPSQNTIAVTAFAPKGTAPKPILIPPENRDAWQR